MRYSRIVAATAVMVASFAAGLNGPTPAIAASCSDTEAWTSKASGAPRWNQTAIWDPVARKMIVFGGWDGTNILGDVLSYDPTTDVWTTIPTQGGPARRFHAAVYDSIGQRMIVFGGLGTGSSNPWALSLTNYTWSEIVPSGTPPPPAGLLAPDAVIFDPINDALIVCGWRPGYPPNQTWKLSLGSSPPSWSQLADLPATSRFAASAIYDPVGQRMVVTCGRNYYGDVCHEYTDLADTWALSLSGTPTWSQILTSGSPGLGSYAAAFYEPQCREMVVYGGVTYSEHCYSGPTSAETETPVPWVRVLNLATGAWINPAPTSGGPPPSRGFHSIAYDPASKRAFVYAGGSFYQDTPPSPFVTHNIFLGDLWSLKMPDVTPPNTIGNLSIVGCTMYSLSIGWTAPADDDGSAVAGYDIRYSSAPIDDSNWDQAYVTGINPTPAAPGTYQSTTISGLSPCVWYYFAIKSYDSSNNYSLTSNSGGGKTKCRSNGFCEMDARIRPTGPPLESVVLDLSAPQPNPAHSEVQIHYTLPLGIHTGVTIGVYDLVGRRTVTLSNGDVRVGPHDMKWDLRDSAGRPVSKGIYWIRLTADGQTRMRTVVVQ